jgi:chromosome segregation ATPase
VFERRHQSSLVELSEKDKLLKGQEFELRKVRDEASAVKNELADVQNIADQLSQLNEVLDETKKTQYSQVSDADRIIASLREQLNESQVELVFAKEAKEKAEGQGASQVSALEHQLEQTRDQLAATQSTMYDRTDKSKGLIQDLKNELDETRIEIARLKTAGSGNSIEAQQAVAQLQEALGTIRVLKESLDQADQVNGEVDGLRSELANAMQSQLSDIERSELEKERLRKSVSDLQLEVEMLSEGRIHSCEDVPSPIRNAQCRTTAIAWHLPTQNASHQLPHSPDRLGPDFPLKLEWYQGLPAIEPPLAAPRCYYPNLRF